MENLDQQICEPAGFFTSWARLLLFLLVVLFAGACAEYLDAKKYQKPSASHTTKNQHYIATE